MQAFLVRYDKPFHNEGGGGGGIRGGTEGKRDYILLLHSYAYIYMYA